MQVEIEPGYRIGAEINIRDQETPPTTSRVLSDHFNAYRWTTIPNDSSDFISMFSIETPNGKCFILKRIRLCSLSNARLNKKLKKILNNEIEGLRTMRRFVQNLTPKIVDFMYYKDEASKSYSYADILFRVHNLDFLMIEEHLAENHKIEPINDLISFLSRLEEIKVPYGFLFNHNNIIEKGSMMITVLGLGLIESAIIHEAKIYKKAEVENAKKIIEYIKIVNPSVSSKTEMSSVTELMRSYKSLCYAEDKQAPVLNIEDYLNQVEPRYDVITGTIFEQNYTYKPLTIRKADSFKINKGWITVYLIAVLSLLFALVVTVTLSIYYGMKYNKFDSVIEELFERQQKVELRANEILGKATARRLLNTIDIDSFKDSTERFFDSLESLVELYIIQVGGLKVYSSRLIPVFYSNAESYKIYYIGGVTNFYRTAEGKYTILGTYHKDDTKRQIGAALLVTDTSGVAEIYRTFNGFNTQNFHAMAPCKNGGTALVGYITSDYQLYQGDLKMIKLNSDKEIEWLYSFPNNVRNVRGLIEDEDGGFIAVGVTTDSNGYYQTWITKIINGDVDWEISLNYYYPYFYSTGIIIQSSVTKNYVVVIGHDYNWVSLAIITGSGQLVQYNQFDWFPNYLYLRDIIEVNDGFIVLATNYYNEVNTINCGEIYKIDSYGNHMLINGVYSYPVCALASMPNGFAIGRSECYFYIDIWLNTCRNSLEVFDSNGNMIWRNEIYGGAIKKMKYENGRLITLMDFNGFVAIVSYIV